LERHVAGKPSLAFEDLGLKFPVEDFDVLLQEWPIAPLLFETSANPLMTEDYLEPFNRSRGWVIRLCEAPVMAMKEPDLVMAHSRTLMT